MGRAGVEAQAHEVGPDEVGGVEGGRGSGEVRVQGEGAEVGSDGGVGGVGEENPAESEGSLGI